MHSDRPEHVYLNSIVAILIAMCCDCVPIFLLQSMHCRSLFDAFDGLTLVVKFVLKERAVVAVVHHDRQICFDCASVYLHSMRLAYGQYLAVPAAVASVLFYFVTEFPVCINSHSTMDPVQLQSRTNFVNDTCRRRTSIADAAVDDDGPLHTGIVDALAMLVRSHRHPPTDSCVAVQSNSVGFEIGRSYNRNHRC